jgi:uncharacterized membrane protein required for colicin V production
MIAAAVHTTAPWWHSLAFNWFDVTVVLVVLLGLWRGRKHGLSKELLPFFQWVAIVAAAGFGYAGLGDWLMHADLVRSVFGKNFTDRAWVLASSYLVIALGVFIVFVALRRHFGPKLAGSSAFGDGEYYLGMISGALRTTCMLIVALALLNAPVYTPQEIALHQQTMMDSFGLKGAQRGSFKSDDITGDYLPYPPTIQSAVFKESLLGPFIKANLGMLLINTSRAGTAKKAPQY